MSLEQRKAELSIEVKNELKKHPRSYWKLGLYYTGPSGLRFWITKMSKYDLTVHTSDPVFAPEERISCDPRA